MTSYGDFSSLLQLGVGIGIGLTVFRAPIELRTSRLSQKMNAEIDALEGINTSFSKNKRRDLMDLRFEFSSIRNELEYTQQPFMIITVVGSFLNLLCLVFCTLYYSYEADFIYQALFLFVSVGWFTLLICALEILARLKLNPISRKFISIQSQSATPGNF